MNNLSIKWYYLMAVGVLLFGYIGCTTIEPVGTMESDTFSNTGFSFPEVILYKYHVDPVGIHLCPLNPEDGECPYLKVIFVLPGPPPAPPVNRKENGPSLLDPDYF